MGVLAIHTSVLTLDPLHHKKPLDIAATDMGGCKRKEKNVCVCVLMIKVTVDEKVIFDWWGGGRVL